MKSRSAALVVLGIFYLSLSSPALAYLDGATGSMILQAAIGGVATAMVFGRAYIAKAKTLFARGASKARGTRDAD